MDICAATARHRTALGDYAGAVAACISPTSWSPAATPAGWLPGPHARIEATSTGTAGTTRWRRYDASWRCSGQDGPGRRMTVPGLASGVAAGVHLLRGEKERGRPIERRMPAAAGRVRPDRRARAAGLRRAGAGARAGGLAVPLSGSGCSRSRPRRRPRWRPGTSSTSRWPGARRAGRSDSCRGPLAQIDRARGLAGDELALLGPRPVSGGSAACSSRPAAWSWPGASTRPAAPMRSWAPSRRWSGPAPDEFSPRRASYPYVAAIRCAGPCRRGRERSWDRRSSISR